jgi:hypothetical protein
MSKRAFSTGGVKKQCTARGAKQLKNGQLLTPWVRDFRQASLVLQHELRVASDSRRKRRRQRYRLVKRVGV